MILTEISPIGTSSLPLYTLKEHLRFGSGFSDDEVQDFVLETYLRAAISAIEGKLGRALLSRCFCLHITAWHEANRQGLPLSPIVSIESITLFDEMDKKQNFPTSDYHLQYNARGPAVLSKKGYFPKIPSFGRAELVFKAGYGKNWTDLPAELTQAVLLLATHFYEHRSASETQVWPITVQTLTEGFRPIRIGGSNALSA